MPANKISILSTRPLGTALTGQAAAKGIAIDTLSFIETAPVRDPALDSRIRGLSRETLAVVFTSMNAVEAVAGSLRSSAEGSAPGFAGISGHWRIFCIGGATRQGVEENFGEASIAGTALSAGELADVIIRAKVPEVCFFCGDQRRDELPEKLKKAGIGVREIGVYTTNPTPQRLDKMYEGIVFFSPSAADSFFSLNKPAPETVLFAIGPTTADAIRRHCTNPVICSVSPDKEALIRLAIDHFQSRVTDQQEGP